MSLFIPDGVFSVPNGNALFDALPDGRLVVTDGTSVWLENNVGVRTFALVGTFPNPILAGFVRVSPNGQRAALVSSDGSEVIIFHPTQVIVEQIFQTSGSASFDSEWIDDNRLAVTLSAIGEGTLLKIFSISDGTQITVLRNLGDASGGVTFDPSSRLLYAGVGYLSDPDPKVGLIKAFPESQWSVPPNNGIDFDASGTPVVNFLSAAFLGFDKFGNLYVGGGDAFGGTGDFNYAAVVRKQAVDNALIGGLVIDPNSSMNLWQRFDPDPAVNTSWFVNANQATGSLYLKSYGDALVNVFRPEI
jgi:hypothetical protein